jgi:hypothetical protein
VAIVAQDLTKLAELVAQPPMERKVGIDVEEFPLNLPQNPW